MSREAGKGSKPRPFSVSHKEYGARMDAIFGEKKKKRVRLINPLNQEEWLCDDYSNTRSVDGVEYVTVFKAGYPTRTHLMRKDALQKVTV